MPSTVFPKYGPFPFSPPTPATFLWPSLPPEQRSHVVLGPSLLGALSNKLCFHWQSVPDLLALSVCVKVKMKSLSCVLTLCDPLGCSPPGSSVHGVFQERILEWVVISFPTQGSNPGLLHCRYLPPEPPGNPILFYLAPVKKKKKTLTS